MPDHDPAAFAALPLGAPLPGVSRLDWFAGCALIGLLAQDRVIPGGVSKLAVETARDTMAALDGTAAPPAEWGGYDPEFHPADDDDGMRD